MSYTAEELYNLLPEAYRVQDADNGLRLRALIEIVAREANVVDADIARLYDNWFIETCENWVAPYIGDLIGATPLHTVSAKIFSEKAYVANTLGYRRRSGTLAVLEQAAEDVSNWAARAVEFFQFLGWRQNVNHIREGKGGTLDIHSTQRLELLDGPFDFAARTVEVRNIASARGRYNIPNIGIFLFRLASYDLDFVSARPAGVAGHLLVHPAGLDLPLFNHDGQEDSIEHLAQEIDLPVPLRRLALHRELEDARQFLVDADPGTSLPKDGKPLEFLRDSSILSIRYMSPDNPDQVSFQDIPIEEVLICNLAKWPAPRPPRHRLYKRATNGADVLREIKAAVDPELGRILFADGIDPTAVEVKYRYGFPGDLGGGPYNRSQSPGLTAAAGAIQTREVRGGGGDLQQAINEWNAGGVIPRSWIISIVDDGSYLLDEPPIPITIPKESRLVITAAGGKRPHLIGDLEVKGTALAAAEPEALIAEPGALILDGVLVEGSLLVKEGFPEGEGGAGEQGDLGGLTIAHSTFIPRAHGLSVLPGNDRLKLRMERCITGPVMIFGMIGGADIKDSILAAPEGAAALEAREISVNLEACTLDGRASVFVLNASNSLFSDTVNAVRTQIGCTRFSYVPAGSRTPPRFRCQPDLAIADAGVTDENEKGRIRARLAPMFTSRQYPNPAFYQLTSATADEILTGAEDGSEMGAWSFLKQPQRAANVREILNEYLRIGLEAGLFYAT